MSATIEENISKLTLAVECDVSTLSSLLTKLNVRAESIREVAAAKNKDLALYAIPVDESALRMLGFELQDKGLAYKIVGSEGVRRGGYEHKAELLQENYHQLFQN